MLGECVPLSTEGFFGHLANGGSIGVCQCHTHTALLQISHALQRFGIALGHGEHGFHHREWDACFDQLFLLCQFGVAVVGRNEEVPQLADLHIRQQRLRAAELQAHRHLVSRFVSLGRCFDRAFQSRRAIDDNGLHGAGLLGAGSES